MPLKIKQMPASERPYERAKMHGISSLTNSELLAIIIKNGTKDENSLEISKRVLLIANSVEKSENISIIDLQKIKGIGEVKAIQIKAVFELAKRLNNIHKNEEFKVSKPKDVADLLMNELRFEKQEKIKVLLLNTKNCVVSIKEVAIGDTNCAGISTKQILTDAVKMQVGKIILVHNHPSGDSTPSSEDLDLTKDVIKAGDILGIKLLDHIVIGNGNYTSIFSGRDFLSAIN